MTVLVKSDAEFELFRLGAIWLPLMTVLWTVVCRCRVLVMRFRRLSTRVVLRSSVYGPVRLCLVTLGVELRMVLKTVVLELTPVFGVRFRLLMRLV